MIGATVALVRREPVLTVALVAGTAALSVVGIVREQVFLWIYLPALVACVAIVVWVDDRYGPTPRSLLALLVIWALGHLAGGLAPDPSGESSILYNTWIIDGALRFDQAVHGFGIGAATAVLIHASRFTARPLLWGFMWGQLIGVVNESAENVFAVFVEDSNVGDWVNTAWDLGWHVIGGLCAVAVMHTHGSREEAPA